MTGFFSLGLIMITMSLAFGFSVVALCQEIKYRKRDGNEN
jgi:hypothetical protein